MQPKDLGAWIEENKNYIYAVARRRADSWQDVDDLAHDIIVRLFVNLHTYRGTTEAEFMRWLRAQIKYALLDHWSGNNKRPVPVELQPWDAAPALDLRPRAETTFESVPMWASLPIEDRIITRMLDAGFSMRAIQRHLGRSHDTSYVSRRIAALQLLFKDYLRPQD